MKHKRTVKSSSFHCFFFFFFFLMSLLIIFCNFGIHSRNNFSDSSFNQIEHSSLGDQNQTTVSLKPKDAPASRRKLLIHGRCTNRDISISQSKDFTSGIPRYIVQIANTCLSGCAPSDIHLHCGWFASARIVNPRTFKRMFYDDCLLNGGKPLKISETIRFTYSNSFMYPLRFKSAKFC